MRTVLATTSSSTWHRGSPGRQVHGVCCTVPLRDERASRPAQTARYFAVSIQSCRGIAWACPPPGRQHSPDCVLKITENAIVKPGFYPRPRAGRGYASSGTPEKHIEKDTGDTRGLDRFRNSPPALPGSCRGQFKRTASYWPPPEAFNLLPERPKATEAGPGRQAGGRSSSRGPMSPKL